MDVERSVNQMRIIPITLRDRIFCPPIEFLSGQAQCPAGHRDGKPVGFPAVGCSRTWGRPAVLVDQLREIAAGEDV